MIRNAPARLPLALALVAALLLPDSARSLTIFGVTLFGSDEEEVDVDAQPYEIELFVEPEEVTGPDGEEIEVDDAVRAASALYSERDDPPSGTSGLLARARGDYARILTALYDRGLYGGSILIRVNGRDPLDIAPDAILPSPVPVEVRVSPGPPFAFGRIDVVNPPPLTEETEKLEELGDAGFAPGELARATRVLAAEDAYAVAWEELGYPKADVTDREIVADHRTGLVDVRLTVSPGRHAVFGPTLVSGTERMDPAFVAYMADLEPGKEYDPDEIEKARKRLRRLRVFRSITIVEADEVGPDGVLPHTVQVAERPLRVFGAGASYSTVDGGQIEAYWQHRNLFGRAERLRIEGRIGGIGAPGEADGGDEDDPLLDDEAENDRFIDELDYFVGVGFEKPGVFTPDTDFRAGVSAEREITATYDKVSALARAGLQHRFSETLTADVALQVERSRIDDAFGERDFLMLGLPSELTHDGRDDELDPTEGIRAVLYVEPFYEFENENTILLAKALASTYYGFGERDRVVLAARAEIGSVVGAELFEIPADKRFLAGGGGSVRGYAYQSIGVELPIGSTFNGVVLDEERTVAGRSAIEGSLEARIKVTEKIGIVPFVDAGQVFEDEIPDFSGASELKVGVGAGVRYDTGLGPLRLDVARAIDPGEDDPSVALYVGIGQAF